MMRFVKFSVENKAVFYSAAPKGEFQNNACGIAKAMP
jgi:hypothetical protein